jgi:hypothetical protein
MNHVSEPRHATTAPSSPRSKAKISPSSMPTRWCSTARQPRPTCKATSASRHPQSTEWCSLSSEACVNNSWSIWIRMPASGCFDDMASIFGVGAVPLRANHGETKRPVKFRLWVRRRMSRGHAKPNRRNASLGRYRDGRRPKAECRVPCRRQSQPILKFPDGPVAGHSLRRRSCVSSRKPTRLPGLGRAARSFAAMGFKSSALSEWRRQRDVGTLGALTPARRGPKLSDPIR